MDEERLNFNTSAETSDHKTTTDDALNAADQSVVESTAEVISETVTEETPSGEAGKEQTPSYSYETYSTHMQTRDPRPETEAISTAEPTMSIIRARTTAHLSAADRAAVQAEEAKDSSLLCSPLSLAHASAQASGACTAM